MDFIAYITKDLFTLVACICIFVVVVIFLIKMFEQNADFFIKLTVMAGILAFIYFFYIGTQNKTIIIPNNLTIAGFFKR